ncbi:MAG: MCE family protein [Cyanobacteria bacterium]|nr:MCE family protein [Cyanobacteria bacterium CG_2015-16_32_12]NCO78316.1 MCE family protein [Cyanobacteria bacterium CG_2015-22_32_23]NCQ03778.1 MCE family protein [Cyanobacteria bacterium CG_2015-09_32_10]NCS84595.1 MCE family protein [Cyanobacteria bacterium CG_2015-02_32_10]
MLRSRLVREGSVGLFLLLGLMVFGGMVFFLKGHKFRNNNYQLRLLFENAGGLREGGRVFFRGVGVGRIVTIKPGSNGVEIWTEIDNSLRIPSQVRVSTIRSGLLGDVSVNIIPETELTEQAKQVDPLSQNCIDQNLILCHEEKISAQASPDLVETLTRLSDRFDNDDIFNNINNAVLNLDKAGNKVSQLTDELSGFATQAKQDLGTISTAAAKVGNTTQSFTRTADSITRTANVTTEQVKRLADDYSNVSTEISSLTQNMNQLINNNKSNLSTAIASLSKTTADVSQLAKNTDQLVTRVNNSADVEKIAQNVQKSSENLTQISNNLLKLSEELNNPTNLVTLQQTLDSARVTFANTAKITSEIEEFTGDAEFRRNLRKLINGLSNLVSYTDLLEKQVELATLLNEVETVSEKNSHTLSTQKIIKLDLTKQQFPTAIYIHPDENTKNNLKSID